MAEALASHAMDTSRYTYTAAPEVIPSGHPDMTPSFGAAAKGMDSAIAAYEQNIMETEGILKKNKICQDLL